MSHIVQVMKVDDRRGTEMLVLFFTWTEALTLIYVSVAVFVTISVLMVFLDD